MRPAPYHATRSGEDVMIVESSRVYDPLPDPSWRTDDTGAIMSLRKQMIAPEGGPGEDFMKARLARVDRMWSIRVVQELLHSAT
jgi:hypothetical protein